MAHHVLKCYSKYFQRTHEGCKPFEFRKNDRDFQANDTIVLIEIDEKTKEETSRRITARIGYVLREFNGIEPGYCCFSLVDVENVKY